MFLMDSYWFSPMPYQLPEIGLDGKFKFGLSLFDQAYFDRMRARIVQASGRGISVSVMPSLMAGV
jgi:hypothetical protein